MNIAQRVVCSLSAVTMLVGCYVHHVPPGDTNTDALPQLASTQWFFSDESPNNLG